MLPPIQNFTDNTEDGTNSDGIVILDDNYDTINPKAHLIYFCMIYVNVACEWASSGITWLTFV